MVRRRFSRRRRWGRPSGRVPRAVSGPWAWAGPWLSAVLALSRLRLSFRRHYGLDELLTVKMQHDLAKLAFGFTVFWAYTFFSQFLVIWYGNMPEETSFLFLRMAAPQWRTVST